MDTGGERVFHFPRLTSCNRGRRTSMTTGWRALGVVLTVGTTIPASAQELATWRPVETAPAAAHLAELLPAGAYTVDARAGDLLRLVGGSRPTVGRLWRSGDAYAFVDESDRLVPDGSAWRFLVPLGTHELVVVAGARHPGHRRLRMGGLRGRPGRLGRRRLDRPAAGAALGLGGRRLERG